MAEALDQVKQRLGRDAVILHTRTVQEGRWWFFGRRPMVEITAATDIAPAAAPVRTRTRGPAASPETGPSVTSRGAEDSRLSTAARPGQAPAAGHGPIRSETALINELGDLRRMVQDLVRESRQSRHPTLPKDLVELYTRLIQNDVAQDIATQLVEQLRPEIESGALASPESTRRRLAAFIESMLPVAGPIQLDGAARPNVIAFIGPTGVGKTTTVAKLAANFSLREGRKVGLVTIDTYRIAAVEQLRTYAQIINVPLEVVMTPSQLRTALQGMHGCDVVLIDTAGRSQHDPIKLNELRCFMDEARPNEVHLVLAGTCSERILTDTIERFAPIGVNRVIFTKLDEAIGFGAILTCLHKAKTKLSYITTGQDVPDDIEIGRPERVAELIVTGGALPPCPN